MEEQREEVGLHLEDALRPLSIPVYAGSDSLALVDRYATAAEAPNFLLRMQDGSWYVMSRDELRSLIHTHDGSTPIEKVVSSERTPNLFPDLPIDSAIPHLARWSILPIQNRAARGTLEGTVTLPEILARYQHP
jgi:CIC family chloride channel protein